MGRADRLLVHLLRWWSREWLTPGGRRVSQIDLRLSLPVMAGGTVVAAVLGSSITTVALLAGSSMMAGRVRGLPGVSPITSAGAKSYHDLGWGQCLCRRTLNSIILVVLWLGPRIVIWFVSLFRVANKGRWIDPPMTRPCIGIKRVSLRSYVSLLPFCRKSPG